MKNLKRNFLFLLLAVLLIGGGVFFFFFQNEAQLTREEKSWISSNENTLQNLSVINDTNLFGKLGKGIFYTFLDEVTEEYNLKINPITISKNDHKDGLSLHVLNVLDENSFSIYEDHYILLSKNKDVFQLDSLKEKKVGVLADNLDYLKNRMDQVHFVSYANDSELFLALEQSEVSYLMVPRIEYMDQILKKNYTILYHFSDISRIYCISDTDHSILYNIFKKFSVSWLNKDFEKVLKQEELDLFLENLNISLSTLSSLQNEKIVYGYQVHKPYELYGDRFFGGIFAEYLNDFAKFAHLDIHFTKYQNDKKMIKDFNNNKITLYANYDVSMNNGVVLDTFIPLSFDLYVHESNPLFVSSLNSLKDKTIYVEEDTLLYQALSGINGLHLETYSAKKMNDVLKKDHIIAIDSQTGAFFKKTILKNYVSRYHEVLSNTYSFRSFGNDTLNTLFSKYLNYVDTNTFVNKGFYNAIQTEMKGSFMNSIARYVLYASLLIGVILLLIYRSSKKVRMQKKVKKEDRLKYIDQLTSLKNRNYLNENLSNWNKNTIYPQSVIMIDLDRIQEINDTLGYEEGDRQIRAAANSLIKIQLENTDVIRTDGNEFLIYLVGYSQKQITSYMNKLKREFKNLPFDYGVTISYSMIMDDLKSIEDALNECTIDIKNQKENKKEEEK